MNKNKLAWICGVLAFLTILIALLSEWFLGIPRDLFGDVILFFIVVGLALMMIHHYEINEELKKK